MKAVCTILLVICFSACGPAGGAISGSKLAPAMSSLTETCPNFQGTYIQEGYQGSRLIVVQKKCENIALSGAVQDYYNHIALPITDGAELDQTVQSPRHGQVRILSTTTLDRRGNTKMRIFEDMGDFYAESFYTFNPVARTIERTILVMNGSAQLATFKAQ